MHAIQKILCERFDIIRNMMGFLASSEYLFFSTPGIKKNVVIEKKLAALLLHIFLR